MAAVSIQSCRGTCEFHSFLSLIVLWSLVGKVTAMTVIQEPPFVSFSQGKELTFNCSRSESGSYHFFWYRQQPGKIELQVLGNLYFFDDKLTEIDTILEGKLTGKWLDDSKKKMSLHFKDLQPGDVGLYMCAVRPIQAQRQAYFAERGTQVLVKDPECENEKGKPSLVLLGPTCHKKSITLVCLAHGFSYAWPLNVIWERDGKPVPRFSVATEEAKAEGKCSFGIASRLRVATAEWNEGHTYSCRVHQGDIADVKEEMTSELIQKPKSGLSEMQLSLRAGQFIFLLLAVKSFAYGTALGIYTACRKKGV